MDNLKLHAKDKKELDSLIQTVRVFSKDIGIDFEIDGSLKRETETLVMAAKEQAQRTNLVKAKIDKSQEDSKCRICGKADKSIDHLLRECSIMTYKEHKRRHDWMGKKIHWEVCRNYGLETKRNGMNMSHRQNAKMKSTKSCGTFQYRQTL